MRLLISMVLLVVIVFAFVLGSSAMQSATTDKNEIKNVSVHSLHDHSDDQNEHSSSKESVNDILTGHIPGDNSQLLADAGPIAVAEATEFEFETMDPVQTSSHIFTIHNHGTEDLVLRKGPKTCKCTQFDISKSVVGPNEQAQVLVKWEVRYSTDEFRHGAMVLTNDPKNPEISFRVFGEVKEVFWTDKAVFLFDRVTPENTLHGSFSIYSQNWADLKIVQVESSLDSFHWESQAIDLSRKLELGALAGFQIKFKSDALLPKGQFNHWIRITGTSPELELSIDRTDEDIKEVARVVEIALTGKVVGRYTVMCDKLDPTHGLKLGSIRSDQTTELKGMFRLYTKEKNLEVLRFSSHPEGLDYTFKPLNPSVGLYQWSVTIPKNMAEGDYRNSNEGWIEFQFDHQEIPTLKIPMPVRLYSPNAEVGY